MNRQSVIRRSVTINDVLDCKVVSDAQVSPDGSRLAFVVADGYSVGDQLPDSQIWIVDVDGGNSHSVTPPIGSALGPRWSPSGRSLAYLFDQTGAGQHRVHVQDMDGGSIDLGVMSAPYHPSLGVRGGIAGAVGSISWGSGDDTIAFLLEDPPANGVVEFDGQPRWTRVWRVDLITKEARPITPEGFQVWEYALGPEGRVAAVISERPGEHSWFRNFLALFDAAGQMRVLKQPPVGFSPGVNSSDAPRVYQVARPVWSDDGGLLSFVIGTWSDRYVTAGDVCVTTATGTQFRNLTEGEPISISATAWDAGSSTMIACGWTDGEQALVRIGIDRDLQVLWQGQAAFADRYQPKFSISKLGHVLAVAREDPQHPREIWTWTGDLTGERRWSQVTALQSPNEDLALAKVETIHWKASDGTSIQGQLMSPPGLGPSPAPTVVFAHGGPTFLHQYLYHAWVEGPYAVSTELLCAAGFRVFLPNPRGSLGWGRSYADQLLGDHGGVDLTDVLSGVDYCVKAGLADPDRLGIGGWSSGGFLAAWATCNTARFRACFMGAGISDWRAMHAGRSVQWTYDTMFLRGNPYELGGLHDQRSPLLNAGKVRTPTLIVHGESDPILPVEQALAYYRALRDLGMEVELVIYPSEGHAVRNRDHIVDLSERVVGWFERWLLDSPSEAIVPIPDAPAVARRGE